MADHDGQGSRAHPGAVAAGEPALQPYCQVTFTHIQQQGGYAGASAGGTQHVGGANIAAAGSAYVASRGQLDQQISEGDAAQQVGNRKSESRGHQSPVGTIPAFSTIRMTVRS